MQTLELENLKYPIGHLTKPEIFSPTVVKDLIHAIEIFPEQLIKETSHLTKEQLDTPYRPDGWTVRQVIHHCADSHMNSFIRFKLTLTEDTPTIKPYFEAIWAELPDATTAPIEASLKLLEGLHTRWIILLKTLSENDLQKAFFHPEHNRNIALTEMINLYAWHGKHHLAHITSLKQRNHWQ